MVKEKNFKNLSKLRKIALLFWMSFNEDTFEIISKEFRKVLSEMKKLKPFQQW